MSDFYRQEILSDLWEEILKIHWNYLEVEESIVKLENRKKLEDCLKEYVCNVQPDRKFVLTETARVFENSIRSLDNFNAQMGITAFDSIRQYANNIYTKPWRKEFRILKLYSGFYQHEIKSNLINAEILFEAMGYRRLSEDVLILDGPICPDQVANVSIDAMIAYVELQLMKHIHTGLDAVGIKCSWLEIYRYREKHIGNTSLAINYLANSFEEKRFLSRQKLLMEDTYGYVDAQPSSNYFSTSTQFCQAECQCSKYKMAQEMSRQRPILCANNFCCVAERQTPSLAATNFVCNNMSCPGHQQYQSNNPHYHSVIPRENGVLMSVMPHSRSLDHYSEARNHQLIPHRHSFDHQQQVCAAPHQYHNTQQQQKIQQQQEYYYQRQNKAQYNFYDSPYECIDNHSLVGDSSSNPYTSVSANPEPGTSAILTGNGVVGVNCNLYPNSTYSHHYNVSGNRIPLPLNISNQLFNEKRQSNNCNDLQEPTYAHVTDPNICSIPKLQQNVANNSSIYKNPTNSQQSLPSCQPEQLISFDDSSIHRYQFNSLQKYPTNNEASNHLVSNNRESPVPLTDLSTIEQQLCCPIKPPTNGETHVYAKPTPKENRQQNNLNSLKYTCNPGETTDISYDSANDDFGNLASTDSERNHRISPTQSTKNQDGVGSVELWNNVYQNVEKKGYSKDFGERKDLLVQSLGLDSLNINNETTGNQNSLTEKRRSQQQLEPKLKTKTFENVKYLQKQKSKSETNTSSSTYNSPKQKSSLDNNTKKIKSAPKQNISTSKPNKSQAKSNDNKLLSKKGNNNNNDYNLNLENESALPPKKISPSNDNTTMKAPSVEWSCNICTFINTNSKPVCEICHHSKGFKMDSPSSTAGGTTTMAHNTPTCA